MKKLLMMAAMMVASATAFAGDSDALKAILKAKTYAEAEALLKSSLGQLANDQEKAKASVGFTSGRATRRPSWSRQRRVSRPAFRQISSVS